MLCVIHQGVRREIAAKGIHLLCARMVCAVSSTLTEDSNTFFCCAVCVHVHPPPRARTHTHTRAHTLARSERSGRGGSIQRSTRQGPVLRGFDEETTDA